MLETSRLIIRPWSTDDADDLYRYASDSRVSELALWPCHTDVAMSRTVIETYFMTNPDTSAIALKESGEVVGCIGLVPVGDEHYPPLPHEREVGYWIGYPLWNHGYTTEALRELIEYCRQRSDISSLLITTDERNTASQRVAEKCGFKLIGHYNDGRAYRLTL